MIGAEPTTSPLPRVCSTTELHGHGGLPWKNLICFRQKKLERETRVELATPCLEGRYSSQLSYPRPTQTFATKYLNGGQGRIRTFVDRSQQIYSLPPLATRAPTHFKNVMYLASVHSQISPKDENGAGNGTRTRNLLITNQLLYQLSYASIA